MTRSPIQVTLREGERRVAKFADSSKEYDLNRDADVCGGEERRGLPFISRPAACRSWGLVAWKVFCVVFCFRRGTSSKASV
jgi:hypothetical protein